MSHFRKKGDDKLIRKTLGMLIISALMFGCTKSTNPISAGSSGDVTMSVAFSDNGSQIGMRKVGNITGATSIRIDSAIVVFARIKFESNIDAVQVDTSNGSTTITVNDSDSSVIFRGPFTVHVRDTSTIDFANQTLPAGTYNGISFFIHRMEPGEGFEDSDGFNHRDSTSNGDSAVTNYSIVVWGAVLKDSVWVPFEYKDNENIEFKVRGTFTIPTSTSSIDIALNFNMGSWFTNPFNGTAIDPTDQSFQNQLMIRHAIRLSLQDGRCGRWDHSRHDFF